MQLLLFPRRARLLALAVLALLLSAGPSNAPAAARHGSHLSTDTVAAPATLGPLSPTAAQCPAQSFPDPTLNRNPFDITAGPDGALWFADSNTASIGRITISGERQDYLLSTSREPRSITVGPDGAVWFTQRAFFSQTTISRIGRLSMSGDLTQYDIPGQTSQPEGITAGPDGNLWFADPGARSIGRLTPKGVFTMFPVPDGSSPSDVTAGPDGNLWFTANTDGNDATLGTISPDGEITMVPVPASGSEPNDIITGPDGNLWFTVLLLEGGAVGRVTPEGAFTFFVITTMDGPRLGGLTVGPAGDNSILYSVPRWSRIGRITTSGERSVLTDGGTSPGIRPDALAIGQDGAVWFVQAPLTSIGRLAIDGSISTFRLPSFTRPRGISSTGSAIFAAWAGGGYSTTQSCGEQTSEDSARSPRDPRDVSNPLGDCIYGLDGDLSNGGGGIISFCTGSRMPDPDGAQATQVVTETFAIPTAGSDPWGITIGPDGNIWFTESGANQIGRMTPTGVFTEFPLPTPGARPFGITAGPDGALWFTELAGNKIGRITTDGQVTEYAIPTADSQPRSITVGPDGALWFTETAGNQIGRITTAGQVTEYAIPTADSQPYGITADGQALWFTEYAGNKIGRITPGGQVLEYALPVAESGPYDIAVTDTGAVWVSQEQADALAKLQPLLPATPVPNFSVYLPLVLR